MRRIHVNFGEHTFSWFWNLKSLKEKCNCSYFFRACDLTPDLTQA